MTKKQNKKEALQEQKPNKEAKKKAVQEEKKEEPTTILGVTVPTKPAPVADVNEEPAYVPKPFELSRKSTHST